MIKMLSYPCFLLLLSTASFAAGWSSVVNLSEVHSVEIEKNKVTIIGSGFVDFSAMTDSAHQTGETKVFGQPSQTVRIITTRGTFEIIPHANTDTAQFGGVPGVASEELSAKWWREMMIAYKKINKGDKITIRYQRDRITLFDAKVKSIIGAGGVKIHEEQKTAEQAAPTEFKINEGKIPVVREDGFADPLGPVIVERIPWDPSFGVSAITVKIPGTRFAIKVVDDKVAPVLIQEYPHEVWRITGMRFKASKSDITEANRIEPGESRLRLILDGGEIYEIWTLDFSDSKKGLQIRYKDAGGW